MSLFIVIVTCIAGTAACQYLPPAGMRVPLTAISLADCQKKAEQTNSYKNMVNVRCISKRKLK